MKLTPFTTVIPSLILSLSGLPSQAADVAAHWQSNRLECNVHSSGQEAKEAGYPKANSSPKVSLAEQQKSCKRAMSGQ